MNKKQKIGEFIVMALFGFVASDMLQYYESMFSQFAYTNDNLYYDFYFPYHY